MKIVKNMVMRITLIQKKDVINTEDMKLINISTQRRTRHMSTVFNNQLIKLKIIMGTVCTHLQNCTREYTRRTPNKFWNTLFLI